MNEIDIVPKTLRGVWGQFAEATTIHPLRIWGWEVVKAIHKHHSSDRAFVDLVLLKCAVRPRMLSEHGMTIVMHASPEARDVFRARLVKSGMFLEAMRLSEMMRCPLTRAEVVALGHTHTKNPDSRDIERFIVYAMRTEGMQELDLRRIYKQFEVEVAHVAL